MDYHENYHLPFVEYIKFIYVYVRHSLDLIHLVVALTR